MDEEQGYDEDSLQHIYALLEKHDLPYILRMVADVTYSRTGSVASFSRSSQLSRTRYSAVSSNYTPSLISSISSCSQHQQDPCLYHSGINYVPATEFMPSPASETFTPPDPISRHLHPRPDSDSNSIASSTARPKGTRGKEGRWFCTFCTDMKSFSTKSDWKKHETRHHETGEDWPCPFRNCTGVFDRQADFLKHCQRHHPDVSPPTDIKIRLLPRVVYGCGFEGCKSVLEGWDERCHHVADVHMKKGEITRSDWTYSNMIHNLLRQRAARNAWKALFSDLQSKQSRHKITWRPENTRVLKQKLECSDMRPSVDVILHTALSLREGRPFNDVVELDSSFSIPSRDSVPGLNTLTHAEVRDILAGNLGTPYSEHRLDITRAPTSHPSNNKDKTFIEPHPGTLVKFDDLSTTEATRRRTSYTMDVDDEYLGLLEESDPQIPPGLDLDPFQMDNSCSSRPFEIQSLHGVDTTPAFDELPHNRRTSRGYIFPKSIRHFASRKGS